MVKFLLFIFILFIGCAHADPTQQAALAARSPVDAPHDPKIEAVKETLKQVVGEEVATVLNAKIDEEVAKDKETEKAPTNAERAADEKQVTDVTKAEDLCRACKAAKGAHNCPCTFVEADDKKAEAVKDEPAAGEHGKTHEPAAASEDKNHKPEATKQEAPEVKPAH